MITDIAEAWDSIADTLEMIGGMPEAGIGDVLLCGEPFLPNSVEGMRMIIACMFLDGVILQATMNVMVGQSAAADKSIVPYVHKPRIRLARRLARESRRGQEKNT